MNIGTVTNMISKIATKHPLQLWLPGDAIAKDTDKILRKLPQSKWVFLGFASHGFTCTSIS